jgi:hypothetical protein
MLTLYAQVINAAQACQCSAVLWAGFWEQRPMMRALMRYFTAIYPHQALFAHDSRRDAFEALLQANEQSTLTQQGPITAGPTLGADLLHRCCSCQRTPAEIAQSQSAVPSPLGSECGDCLACKPWIELAIEAKMPVHRAVHCFGTVAESKPKPKRQRPSAKAKAKDIVFEGPADSSQPEAPKKRPPTKRQKVKPSAEGETALPESSASGPAPKKKRAKPKPKPVETE